MEGRALACWGFSYSCDDESPGMLLLLLMANLSLIPCSRFTQYPCTRGHYCELGTISPIDCPPGRFRSTTLGGSASDCATCTGGYTCQSATVTPDPCPAGTYCPPGSVVPLTCPPSYYCPEVWTFMVSSCSLLNPPLFYKYTNVSMCVCMCCGTCVFPVFSSALV